MSAELITTLLMMVCGLIIIVMLTWDASAARERESCARLIEDLEIGGPHAARKAAKLIRGRGDE